VPGHGVGVRLVESAKIATDLRVEVSGLDILGQVGLVGTGGLSGVLPRPTGGPTIVTGTPAAPVVAPRGAATTISGGAARVAALLTATLSPGPPPLSGLRAVVPFAATLTE
jgi:hypothetical protein